MSEDSLKRIRSTKSQIVRVARGGMGAILKGRDTDIGRDLAVKVLLEQHVANADLVRRFAKVAKEGPVSSRSRRVGSATAGASS